MTQMTRRRIQLVAIALSVFIALPASAQSINEDFKIVASDGAAEDRFGRSVAISGTTAIVGAYWDDDAGSNSGSAYLFDRGILMHSVDLSGSSHISPLHINLNQKINVDLKEHGLNLYIKEVTINGVVNTFGGSWANDIGFQYRSTGSSSPPFGQSPAAGLFQNGNGIGVGPATLVLEVPFTISNAGQLSILLFDTSYDVAGQPDATWQSGTIDITLGQCLPFDTVEPYGILDFFDISSFLDSFMLNDPSADITGDGQFDFFDISAFLIAFSEGCP